MHFSSPLQSISQSWIIPPEINIKKKNVFETTRNKVHISINTPQVVHQCTSEVLHLHSLKLTFQENYNTPVEHTPGNPPSQLWKESLYSLLVKV